MWRMPDDPFDMLGLLPSFDLSSEEIERAYLHRAASLHPDVRSLSAHGMSEDGEGARWDGDRMSVLNAAREVLRDPERRANALLEFLGGPSASEERSLPEGYLMEVMETRERIESILRGDGRGTRSTVEREAREARAMHEREVARLFASLRDPPERERLREIRVRLNAWRYVERLLEQIDPVEGGRRADSR